MQPLKYILHKYIIFIMIDKALIISKIVNQSISAHLFCIVKIAVTSPLKVIIFLHLEHCARFFPEEEFTTVHALEEL
jgi:hypothetical protein